MALNNVDVSTVKGMLARGDAQRDVASYFGIVEERISEISEGYVGRHVAPASEERLPPAGPYVAGRTALKAIDALISLRLQIDKALDELDVFERDAQRMRQTVAPE